MYDWANSAFATTIMGAIFAHLLRHLYRRNSVLIWGYAVAIGSLIAALLSPILGGIADFRASKKLFLGIFAALGIISTALLFFVSGPEQQTLLHRALYPRNDWILLARWFLTTCCRMWQNRKIWTSFFPRICCRVYRRWSAAAHQCPHDFLRTKLVDQNMTNEAATQLMMRLSLASVAIWWAVFSIPPFRRVKEPAAMAEKQEIGKKWHHCQPPAPWQGVLRDP